MNISIVVPTYQQADTLAETIESALAQTVPCEIIVVVDGSTDHTNMVLLDYEERVKIVRQRNKGLSSARNTGIMNATGDYVLFLDSDDTLKPNCVERILQVAEETNGDVIAPSFTCFGEQNQEVLLNFRPSVEEFKQGNRVGYCSAVKRSVLLEVGGFSPRMTWGWEDYHLWFDLLERGKSFFTIPESLWNYRVRAGSMISVANQHSEELWHQIKKDMYKLW